MKSQSFPIASSLLAIFVGLAACEPAHATTVVGWGQSSSDRIAIPPDLTNATAIAAGTYHGIALRTDGTLALWGGRDSGLTNVSVGPDNVIAISAGYEHNLVMRQDGSLVAWGQNTYGQTNIPAGETTLRSISAGGYHNLGLRADGTILAWGRNTSGQTNVPVGLSNVTMVAAGGYHNLALRSDGGVVGWGLNDNGQNSPPAGLSNVVAIAAGGWHNLALRADGRVIAWGYNGEGQTNVPASLSNVVAVAAGWRHNMAIKADGSAVAWGSYLSSLATIPVEATNIVALAGGFTHGLALLADNLQSPVIVRQPASARAFQGAGVLLGIGVVTANPPSYQWLWESSIIPGATNATFPITNISGAQSGNYSVVVSNAFGVVLSSNAVVTVVEAVPYIFSPPQHVTTFLGGNAIFTLKAFGSEPLRYQWQFNGTAISGATNSAFQLFNAADTDAGNYTVVISNAVGAVTSAVAQLAVPHVALWDSLYGNGWQSVVPADLTNPVALNAGGNRGVVTRADGSITGLWQSTNVFSGRSNLTGIATFYSHALGIEPNGRIATWAGSATPATNIPPAATNIIQVAVGYSHSLALRNDGRVFVWGNNSYGQTNLPSDVGTVSAIAAGDYNSVVVRTDGSLRAWGLGTGTNVSASVTDAVEVAATEEYGLVLRRNGTVTGWGVGTAKTPPGGLANVVGIGAGGYHGAALTKSGGVVTWGQFVYPLPPGPIAPVPAGLASANAISAAGMTTLAIIGRKLPLITQEPLDATIISGGAAVFRSTAVGGMPLHLQWQRNGTNLSGATWPTLAITNLTPIHNGAYCLVASNLFGMITSQVATLSVTPLQITAHPTNRTVFGGDATTLSVTAQGANLNYQWKFNDTPIGGATNQSLTRSLLTTNDAGTYSVVISNAFGSLESSAAQLTVLPISITTTPGTYTNYSGIERGFSVAAQKNGPFTYQWRFNGVDLIGETNSLVYLYPSYASNSGSYSVRVSNPYGSAVGDIAILTVLDQSPFFTTQPIGKRAWLFGDADYYGQANGSKPLSYRWTFGTNFIHPIYTYNENLNLRNVWLSASGNYFLHATNFVGYTSSVPATLTVSPVCIWPKGAFAASPTSNHFDWMDAAAGSFHFIALRTNRTLVAYGANTYGQLNIPAAATNIIAIASGANHSLALRGDGVVLGWGDNTYGQRTIPVGLSNVSAIACGSEFSYALRSNGTVAAWGRNTAGETTHAAVLSNVTAIACGDYHGVALLQGGSVRAWGQNTYGQTNVPATLSNATAVAAGSRHSIVLRSDGTTLAWGSGLGTNQNANATNITKLAARSAYNLALVSHGRLIAWGGGGPSLPSMSNVVAFAAGPNQSGLAIVANPQSPQIIVHPVSQAVLSSQTLALQVTATGTPPLAYQWLKAGTNLPHLTNATLTLSNLTRASGGYYSAHVSNLFGAAVSGEANVRVIVPQQLSIAGPDTGAAHPTSRDADGGTLTTNDLPFFSVWASSNLVDWVALPDALSVSNGVLHILDASAGTHPQRFYRLSEQLLWRMRVPQQVGEPVRQPDGSVSLEFGDSNGTRLTPTDIVKFEVHASTNLVNWVKLTNSIAVTNGLLRLVDPAAGSFSRRFYRILEKP